MVLRELRRYIRSTREMSFADSADAVLYETVNIVFERALEHMHKMPRVWIDFCEHLDEQRLITRTRKTYNRALRALPPTQHWRIWERLLAFVGRIYVRETAACVWHRFVDDHLQAVQICPEGEGGLRCCAHDPFQHCRAGERWQRTMGAIL